MAEWGWRSPRRVQDPILGQILRSLEVYLIDKDQTTVTNEKLLSYFYFLIWYFEWPAKDTVTVGSYPPPGGVMDGMDLSMNHSWFGVDDTGAPYGGDSVQPADRAAISFDTDGNPFLVRIGGPTTPPMPEVS